MTSFVESLWRRSTAPELLDVQPRLRSFYEPPEEPPVYSPAAPPVIEDRDEASPWSSLSESATQTPEARDRSAPRSHAPVDLAANHPTIGSTGRVDEPESKPDAENARIVPPDRWSTIEADSGRPAALPEIRPPRTPAPAARAHPADQESATIHPAVESQEVHSASRSKAADKAPEVDRIPRDSHRASQPPHVQAGDTSRIDRAVEPETHRIDDHTIHSIHPAEEPIRPNRADHPAGRPEIVPMVRARGQPLGGQPEESIAKFPPEVGVPGKREAPTIRVTIGRVVVRAEKPRKVPSAPVAPRRPSLSLEAYLKERSESSR